MGNCIRRLVGLQKEEPQDASAKRVNRDDYCVNGSGPSSTAPLQRMVSYILADSANVLVGMKNNESVVASVDSIYQRRRDDYLDSMIEIVIEEFRKQNTKSAMRSSISLGDITLEFKTHDQTTAFASSQKECLVTKKENSDAELIKNVEKKNECKEYEQQPKSFKEKSQSRNVDKTTEALHKLKTKDEAQVNENKREMFVDDSIKKPDDIKAADKLLKDLDNFEANETLTIDDKTPKTTCKELLEFKDDLKKADELLRDIDRMDDNRSFTHKTSKKTCTKQVKNRHDMKVERELDTLNESRQWTSEINAKTPKQISMGRPADIEEADELLKDIDAFDRSRQLTSGIDAKTPKQISMGRPADIEEADELLKDLDTMDESSHIIAASKEQNVDDEVRSRPDKRPACPTQRPKTRRGRQMLRKEQR